MAFVAVYGHVNVDHILLLKALPTPETTLPVQSTLTRLGGTGGNIARAAQSLGVPTALAAFVGDDFPEEHRRTLEASGLDLTDLRRLPGSTSRVWVLSVPDGPQSCIIDQGVMGDTHQRPKLDLAWLVSDWVHFTTGNPDEWYATAQEVAAAGKRIAFDPAQEISYRWPARLFEKFLNLCDVFFCNEAELKRAQDLLGYADPEQLLDHADRVVATRGRRGVLSLAPRERLEVPACPVRGRQGLETTGAGDVFRAGVYAALHRDRPWEDALRSGAAASSLFLEEGGQRFPSREALDRRLAEWHP